MASCFLIAEGANISTHPVSGPAKDYPAQFYARHVHDERSRDGDSVKSIDEARRFLREAAHQDDKAALRSLLNEIRSLLDPKEEDEEYLIEYAGEKEMALVLRSMLLELEGMGGRKTLQEILKFAAIERAATSSSQYQR